MLFLFLILFFEMSSLLYAMRISKEVIGNFYYKIDFTR